MPTSKNFAWINFCEWPGKKNFTWIYFREDNDFVKYFSLKKRKTTLLSIKSFYKSSKNYKYLNNFYMFDGVWSMKVSKALSSSSRTYLSSNQTKMLCSFSKSRKSSVICSNSHCLMTYFPHCLRICEKGEEEGQNWENSKACTFGIPISSISDEILNFISRGLIFAN